MKVQIRYASRGGNTKKLAEAIGGAVGAAVQDAGVPLDGRADLLFLGGSVYGGGIDDSLKSFIYGLDPGLVGEVAVFSTAAIKKSAYPQIKALLDAKGIKVSDREFHCRGQFAVLHRGRPNSGDQEEAAHFARSFLEQ